jgi:hypothetical protein
VLTNRHSSLTPFSAPLKLVSLRQPALRLHGVGVALFTLLFGQGLGFVFGLNDDAIKSRLKADATEVQDTIYQGYRTTAKAVVDKSWSNMQRAHLHAGGRGTTAVAQITVLCLVGASRKMTMLISLALGGGRPGLCGL